MTHQGGGCSICADPRVAEIDEALSGDASLSMIAERFEVSRDAVFRHRRAGHAAVTALEERFEGRFSIGDFESARKALDELFQLGRAVLIQMYRRADRGDGDFSVQHIAEVRRIIELMGRITGELKEAERLHRASDPVELIVTYDLPESVEGIDREVRRLLEERASMTGEVAETLEREMRALEQEINSPHKVFDLTRLTDKERADVERVLSKALVTDPHAVVEAEVVALPENTEDEEEEIE